MLVRADQEGVAMVYGKDIPVTIQALQVLGKFAGLYDGLKNNYDPGTSGKRGLAYASLILFAGAVAIAFGVAIPPLSIGTLVITTAATPITASSVMAVAMLAQHYIGAYTSDKTTEDAQRLADKLDVSVTHLLSYVPIIQNSFPTDKNGAQLKNPMAQGQVNSNINRS